MINLFYHVIADLSAQKIYKNLLLDPSSINEIITGFFSPVNNYLPKSKDFK